jgi:hypothetical protein
MVAVDNISAKRSKISTSTQQQRAVIFVNRKPDASGVKLAQKKAPGERLHTKLAGKAVTARSKLADKGAPQRVRVALAARR